MMRAAFEGIADLGSKPYTPYIFKVPFRRLELRSSVEERAAAPVEQDITT